MKTYYVLHDLGEGTGTLIIGFDPGPWRQFIKDLNAHPGYDKDVYSKLIALYYINNKLTHVSFSKLSPAEVEKKWTSDGRNIEGMDGLPDDVPLDDEESL